MVSGHYLPIWLPAPPKGWAIGRIDASEALTRIVLRRNASDTAWDGCGVLNLYAFTGSVPRQVIEADIASTLRIVNADNSYSQPLFVPSRRGLHVTAASAAGGFAVGGHQLRAQYTAYLVEGEVDGDHEEGLRGGLVEHNIFIAAEADARTHRELIDMDDDVYTALRLAVS